MYKPCALFSSGQNASLHECRTEDWERINSKAKGEHLECYSVAFYDTRALTPDVSRLDHEQQTAEHIWAGRRLEPSRLDTHSVHRVSLLSATKPGDQVSQVSYSGFVACSMHQAEEGRIETSLQHDINSLQKAS